MLSRDGRDHQNEKTEDAITSMVFSPLTFMQPSDALDCLRAVIGPRLADAVGERRTTKHKVEFWPRGLYAEGLNGPGDTSCEPDLVVTFWFESGKPVVIIGEMKWDWSMAQSALERELERERAAVHADRKPAIIVMFAVSKRNYGHLAVDAKLLTWKAFRERLAGLMALGETRSPARWAELVSRFLEKADVNAFSGFAAVVVPPVLIGRNYAFWKGQP